MLILYHPRQAVDSECEVQVVAINPGRLAKGVAGGSFAHLLFGPSPEGVAEVAGRPAATNAPVQHRVDVRCRVECRHI